MAPQLIRILHIVFSMDAGGLENGIVNVANHLDEDTFDIHIVCLERAGAFASRLKPSVKLYVLGRTGTGFSIDLLNRLRHLVNHLQPDLIRTHNLGPLAYGSLAVNLGLNYPILHSEHGKLQPADTTFRRLLERRLLYLTCRGVLTVSSELEKAIAALSVFPSKVFTLRNGVDTERFKPGDAASARTAIGLPTNCLCIGMIGRLIELKRHEEMVKAFEQLCVEFEHLHLLLVGNDGPLKERVHTVIQASPYSHRIHLLPFRADPEVYYHAMDLLVMPSLTEGLANVVLEGMASGLPLLVHHACGNAEVAGDGQFAIVKDLGSADKIAYHTRQALSHPEFLSCMGAAARQHAQACLSIDTMVAAYAEHYKRLNRSAQGEAKASAEGNP